MRRHHFPAVAETGVADGQNPKYDADDGEDERQEEEAGHAVKTGIDEKASPLAASGKIQGRNKDYAKIHHTILWFRVYVVQPKKPALLTGSDT